MTVDLFTTHCFLWVMVFQLLKLLLGVQLQCSILPVATLGVLIIQLIILAVHVQMGYSSQFVHLSVCPCLCVSPFLNARGESKYVRV